MKQLIIIGAGKGAELVLKWVERFNEYEYRVWSEIWGPFPRGAGFTPDLITPVGILDDCEDRHGQEIMEVPIIGATNYLKRQECLCGQADCLANTRLPKYHLICSSSNVPFRKKIAAMYSGKYPFLNSIRSELADDIKIGEGNIIFPGVSTDWFTEIGSHNVMSTGCAIAHHNKIGDCNLFGPGCMFSGSVTIGSGCRFGSLIVVEPCVTIGDDCNIASGSVIVGDVPSGTSIKAIRNTGQPIYQGERRVR